MYTFKYEDQNRDFTVEFDFTPDSEANRILYR